MENDIKVKSLYKALQVLDCFVQKKTELGITEISSMLGLYKSNVHNIISTFEKTGYIEKNPLSDKYRLGLKMLEFTRVVSSNITLRSIVLPYMQEISNKANEVVFFGIPNEGSVLYLDLAYPKNAIAARTVLGEKAPMYCTAIGKAMLAFMTEEVLEKAVEGGFERFTDNTISNREDFLSELKKVRMNGYAVDNMEHEFGVKCIGMPVFDSEKNVVAGLSISGPSPRFNDENIEYYTRLLRENIINIQNRI